MTVQDSAAASVHDNDKDSEGNLFTARKRRTRGYRDWTSDVCSSDRYSHDGSETTSDSFTYKACDNGTTNGSPDGKCSGTATVSITVTPVNDAPAASNDGDRKSVG